MSFARERNLFEHAHRHKGPDCSIEVHVHSVNPLLFVRSLSTAPVPWWAGRNAMWASALLGCGWLWLYKMAPMCSVVHVNAVTICSRRPFRGALVLKGVGEVEDARGAQAAEQNQTGKVASDPFFAPLLDAMREPQFDAPRADMA